MSSSVTKDGMRFDGRVAVITGAGRGLGRSYALLLAARGAKVVVNDPGEAIAGATPDGGVAQAVVEEIRSAGGKAIANTDTVATFAGGQAIVQAALETWGRIDILIHNAGNVRYGSIREISYEDFKAVVDVHLMGAFHVVKAAHPVMCDAGYGRIVLTSSIGGIYGNERCVNYGTSKSGMIGLSNIAAIEGAPSGVTSNIILPSAVTRMADGLDVSRYPPMLPQLVAPAVAWLAHEDCPLSGEMIAAIGGRIARVYIAEARGVYRPEWTIEDVAGACADILDTQESLRFGLHGHAEHIDYSFAMARAGTPELA